MSDLLPYAPVLLKLLGGVLYVDDRHWELLRSYEQPVAQHVAAIGLRLHLDPVEGYAFLTQPDPDPDAGGVPLPRLVRRTRLSYDATLLCVLLREALQQFDAREPDQGRFVLNRSEMQELMQLFYPEQTDETRLAGKIDRIISQVESAGFLRRLHGGEGDSYEVLRILKAKLSADALVVLRERLRRHLDEGDE